MSEKDRPSDADDAPALEVVDEAQALDDETDDAALDAQHDPTTQGLGFDAVGFLAGPPSTGSRSVKRHAATGQGLGFDPVAHMLGLAPKSSAPPSAPEQARQTMPTRTPSQRPEKPALRRISTQDFDAPDVPRALAEAEAALAASPHDEEAQRLVVGLRAHLERIYLAELSPLDRVVTRIADAPVEALEDESRLLLSLVDDTQTIRALLDASTMIPVDAMRAMLQLVEKGVVRFVT